MDAMKTALTVLMGLPLAACSIKAHGLELDAATIETQIKANLAKEGVVVDKVKCTEGVALEKGAKLTCQIHIGDKQYEQIATLSDPKSLNMDLTWPRGEVVYAHKLVTMMTPQLTEAVGAPAVIDCGEPLLFLDKDRAARCKITIGGVTTQLATTLDDKWVPVRWQLEPEVLLRVRLEEMVTPSVREKLGATATVTCDGEHVLAKPANKILDLPCTVHSGAKTLRINVHGEDDANGKLIVSRWKSI